MEEDKLIKLNNSEIKEHLLNLLLSFDEFCKKNNINYFLSGGTLLGAVRHQGFIPWDDDVDLMMVRCEYEKLKKAIVDNENFQIKYYINDQSYFYPFIKVIDPNIFVRDQNYIRYEDNKVSSYYNLFIDIFPIDGISKYKIFQRIKFARIALNKKLSKVSLLKYNWVSKEINIVVRSIVQILFYPVIVITRLAGHAYFLNKIESIAKKHPFDKSEYVAACTGLNGLKEVISKQELNSSYELSFENHLFKVPVGARTYLSNLYGDYMQLPPEEQRKTHFNGEIYKVDKS